MAGVVCAHLPTSGTAVVTSSTTRRAFEPLLPPELVDEPELDVAVEVAEAMAAAVTVTVTEGAWSSLNLRSSRRVCFQDTYRAGGSRIELIAFTRRGRFRCEHLDGERGEKKDERESAVEHHGRVRGRSTSKEGGSWNRALEKMNGRKRHQAGTLV